ncbi:MAG: PD-(D/E)XK nuclease family protein [Elusimicrobiales bacterium]|nr:PD-(D/E)XK nuclease family protein [Elusimicrobiales bacterium]
MNTTLKNEIERIILVKPTENFINTIAKFIISSNLDLLNTIIIFPNIRPSYYLKKEISKLKNSQTILPHITSLDEFIKEFSLNQKNNIEEADFYDAFYIFSTTFKDELIKLYGKDLKEDDILKITPIFWGEFEELKINHIESKNIKEYDFLISDFISKGNINLLYEKFVRYSSLYERFYSILEESNKMTRAMMYFYTSKNLSKNSFSQNLSFILAGFFMMTKSEIYIFEKIYKDFNSYFFFHEHELLNNLSKNLSFMKYIKIENKYLADFEIKASPSKHSEIFTLKNDIIRISKVEDNKIYTPPSTAIVIPDQNSLIPLIENLINNVDEFNITIPYSVKNTPWMSLFEMIRLIIVDKVTVKGKNFYSLKRIFSFFSHHYIKKIFNENILLEERFDIFLSIKELEEKFDNSKEAFGFLCHVLESFENVKSIYEFIEAVEKLITKIITNVKDSEFINAGYLIINEIRRIKQKNFVNLNFKDLDSYFQLLENIFSYTSFPFKGEPLNGLQCLGILEARLLNFKNVFIIDANDGVIPYYKNNAYILSEWIRKKLGLPTYSDSFNLYYYHISNLILSSEKTIVYFVENKRIRKSPIIEKMIWEKEKHQKKMLNIQTTMYPKLGFSTHKPEKIKKDENIKKMLQNFVFSYSSLDTYLECPIMFYYQYVLGITNSNKVDEIETAEIGQIFHKVLEKTLTLYKNQNISSIKNDNFINYFNENLNDETKKFDKLSPQIYFIKSQISLQAQSLIERMKKDFKDYEIKDVEMFKNYEINSDKYLIKVFGKIDLVLENKSDIIIIDFKTSSDPSLHMPKLDYFIDNSKALSYGSIQMPFYILLFKENKNTNAGIISLGSKFCEYKMLYKNKEDKEKYQHLIEEFIISKIKEIIETDYFEVSKNPPCKDCIYYQICGI